MREDNLRRLLQEVYKPESAPPGFKERLLKRLVKETEEGKSPQAAEASTLEDRKV